MAVLSWDWDDTVADGRDYPRAGRLNPKAVRGVRMSHAYGHENIFNSCRMGEAEAAAIECAVESNLPFSHFNQNCPARVAYWGGHDTRKLGADVYIDDKISGNGIGTMSMNTSDTPQSIPKHSAAGRRTIMPTTTACLKDVGVNHYERRNK